MKVPKGSYTPQAGPFGANVNANLADSRIGRNAAAMTVDWDAIVEGNVGRSDSTR
jgi:hypothetical protein